MSLGTYCRNWSGWGVFGPGAGYLSGDCVYIRLGPEYLGDTGRGIYGVEYLFIGISISVWGLCIYQTGAGVSRRHGPVYIGMTLGPLYLRLGPEYLSVWGRGIYQAGTGRWCPSERGGLWL